MRMPRPHLCLHFPLLLLVLSCVHKLMQYDALQPAPFHDLHSVVLGHKTVFRTLGTGLCVYTQALTSGWKKHRGQIHRKRLVLLYLSLLLLLLSYAPEPNPGPSTTSEMLILMTPATHVELVTLQSAGQRALLHATLVGYGSMPDARVFQHSAMRSSTTRTSGGIAPSAETPTVLPHLTYMVSTGPTNPARVLQTSQVFLVPHQQKLTFVPTMYPHQLGPINRTNGSIGLCAF